MTGSYASVIGSNVGFYSNTLKLESNATISSDSMGCLSDKGYGSGIFDEYFVELCGSSGGSYGGFGGPGEILVDDAPCNAFVKQ